ncbi:MAG: hypothetical protein HOJ35_12900 [Bdellovibrionales bacterium]|nr:hypothetical protein [Bdellovibrionales bacterium]
MSKKKFLIIISILFITSYVIWQRLINQSNQITVNDKIPDKQKHTLVPLTKIKKLTNKTPKNNHKMKIKKEISNHFRLIDSIGEIAEVNYLNSLEKLKENKDKVTLELTKQYENTAIKSYKTRQQIMETIRALHSEKSIPILEKVINSDIPQEEYEDLHQGSTRLEEGIIRLTAIEAIGHFVNDSKNKELATDLLLKIVSTSNNPLPLKRQAVREFLQASSNKEQLTERKTILKNIIPIQQHFIITEKVDEPEMIDMDKHTIGGPESYHLERDIDKQSPTVNNH